MPHRTAAKLIRGSDLKGNGTFIGKRVWTEPVVVQQEKGRLAMVGESVGLLTGGGARCLK